MRPQKLSRDEDEQEHTKLLLKDLGSDGELVWICACLVLWFGRIANAPFEES